MKTIWKWTLPLAEVGVFELDLPKDAWLIKVDMQQGAPCLWAMVDPEAPKERRKFAVTGTGHPLPQGCDEYVGSFQLFDGRIIAHLFVEVRK